MQAQRYNLAMNDIHGIDGESHLNSIYIIVWFTIAAPQICSHTRRHTLHSQPRRQCICNWEVDFLRQLTGTTSSKDKDVHDRERVSDGGRFSAGTGNDDTKELALQSYTSWW
jgi:hypothetical protein